MHYCFFVCKSYYCTDSYYTMYWPEKVVFFRCENKKKERKTRSLYTQVGAKDIDDTEVTNMHNYVDGECTKVSARW